MNTDGELIMKCFCRVEVLGFLGSDPVLYRTREGVPVAKLSVGVSMSNGKNADSTEWVKVVLFHDKAELAVRCLKTGALIMAVGRLHNNKYLDRDGKNCSVTEVIASDFIMFPKSANEETAKVGPSDNKSASGDQVKPVISLDDAMSELPF